MQFEWNLDPELVQLFGFLPIRYYTLLFVGGLLSGYFVLKRLWINDGLSLSDLEKLYSKIIIGTIVGARLGHCLLYDPAYYLNHPLEIILPFTFSNGSFEFTGIKGLASHGGITGVILGVIIYAKQTKTNVFTTLDKVSIGGALAAVFIRLGNFMNSEIFGKATESNFGVIFKRYDNVLRHPAQLYESISYLIIFSVIYSIYRKKQLFQSGYIFGLFITLLFVSRFLIEFLKENQVAFEQSMLINMGQILSIPFIVIGIIIMYNKRVVEKNKCSSQK